MEIKKVNYFFVILVLLMSFSCSKEKDTIIIENTTETASNIVIELPENAINAKELLFNKGVLAQKKIELNINYQKELFEGEQIIYYRRVFVIYPMNWTSFDRYMFLSDYIETTGKDVYTAPDNCEYVDTWYIEVSRGYPPSGTQNKSKNVIVATNTNADTTNTNSTEDTDGPGAVGGEDKEGEDIYTFCEDVPLPPEYYEIIIKDDTIGGGDLGSGPNSDPTLPQE